MLELLAAIQSADPTGYALWPILLFAAGMYPFGFMFGTVCSPCCACRECIEGYLPDTLTVTFEGLPNQSKSDDLCNLQFVSCFGSGAAAHVTSPGGDPGIDDGPIAAISLTNNGSGYAKLGRIAPTITASGSGSGATLTVSLSQSQGTCNLDYWSVSGVSVTKGGTGYYDGEPVTFSIASGDTEEVGAYATINTTRSAPTLTASVAGGSGATLTLSTTSSGTPTTWTISSIAVTAGGTGYLDNTSVTISKDGDDVEVAAAYAVARTNRSQPTLTASISSAGAGTGASITPTITKGIDFEGRDAWNVTAFTINNAGTGYAVDDPIAITVTDGEESLYSFFQAKVSTVDVNGGVTGIQIDYGGEYFKNTGVIDTVVLYYGGAYYSDDGVIGSVSVSGGGIYYREDATQTPYVADITVSVGQALPSNGSGAEITAVVEDDTSSPDFGKIMSLTIDNAGDNYLAWAWRNTECCGEYYDAVPIVLDRSSTNPCEYIHSMCGVGNRRNVAGHVKLTYNGPSVKPTIQLVSEIGQDSNYSAICNTNFESDENVTDCSVWDNLTFAAPSGATATVTTGDEYDPAFRNKGGYSCNICCKGDAPMPLQVSVSVQDNRASKGFDYTGDYVVDLNEFLAGSTLTSGLLWNNRFYIGTPGIDVSVGTIPCSEQTTTAFEPDANGCDQCHYECRFTAGVRISESGILDSEQTSATYFYNPDDYCAACQPTPLCGPVGQSETLCQNVFGGQCDFVVTVNAV